MAKPKLVKDVEPTSKDLVDALVQAIQITKPIEKKNPFNRKNGDPWRPKDGSAKLKLKRKHYQHGILIDPDLLDNPTIDSLNKIKPGVYFNGWLKVIKRKDQGIDIDYPVRTPTQRMRMSSEFGVRSLKDLCDRCIEEAKTPKVDAPPTDNDE